MHIKIINSIFKGARQAKPNIINIAGGGVVSADPEMAATIMDFDIGVIGEGENAIIEILDALSSKLPLEDVPGIILNRAEKSPLLTKTRPVNMDISKLP
ncbi:MAG: cobalamin-dependent protein [Magnetococcales bacterium]|nr:cobalamin-dependent protein [Magnetococcales bacterium]